MDYNTLQAAMEQGEGEQQIDALSVYRAFEQIEDGRRIASPKIETPPVWF